MYDSQIANLDVITVLSQAIALAISNNQSNIDFADMEEFVDIICPFEQVLEVIEAMDGCSVAHARKALIDRTKYI